MSALQFTVPVWSLARAWHLAWEHLLQLVLPGRCARCGGDLPWAGEGTWLCAECRSTLLREVGPQCPRCALPSRPGEAAAVACPRCANQTWRFARVVALGGYSQALRGAVLACKRPAAEALSLALSELFWQHRAGAFQEAQYDVVVPVPMHWRRRWARGINSPECIAGYLGQHLRVPVANHLLVRRRATLPQAPLRPRERVRNLRAAFRVRGTYRLHQARVLLVDDVLTTGATANAAALALRRGGAAQVDVAVLARASGASIVRGAIESRAVAAATGDAAASVDATTDIAGGLD